MNKNISLFFLLFPIVLFAQSYEIKYQKFFSTIHGNLEEIVKELKNNKDDGRNQHKIEETLTYSNGISFYGSPIIEYEVEDEKKSNEHTIAVNQVEIVNFYKNQNQNILVENYINWAPVIYGEDILVKTDLSKYDWEITDQKSVISGYPCTLATTINHNDFKVMAWFTDKIAINDGPDIYWGLPGLILQVQISDKILIAATSVQKLKNDVKIIEPTTKGKVMTRKEFKEFRREMSKPRTITTPDGRVLTISGSK